MASSRFARVLSVVCVVAFVAGVAAQPAPAGTGDVSQKCADAAATFQDGCQREIAAAQDFFNVATPAAGDTTAAGVQVTQAQIDEYAATAPPASPGCCAAACEFNNKFCSCEPAVLDLATQFAGGDPGVYQSVATAFATGCKFDLLLGGSCPANYLTATSAACPARK